MSLTSVEKIINSDGSLSRTQRADWIALMREHSSHKGYASLLLTIAGAPVVEGVTDTDQVITAYNVEGPRSIVVDPDLGCDASASAGTMTIGETGIYQIGFFASCSSDTNNVVMHLTPYINDGIGLVEVTRKFGTTNDVGVISMHAIVPYTAGDVIDIRRRIETGTANISWKAMGLHVHRVG